MHLEQQQHQKDKDKGQELRPEEVVFDDDGCGAYSAYTTYYVYDAHYLPLGSPAALPHRWNAAGRCDSMALPCPEESLTVNVT